MSAEVIEWLRSAEGEAWSRNRTRFLPLEADAHMGGGMQGPGNPAEDPCGRPPVTGKSAARKTGAA